MSHIVKSQSRGTVTRPARTPTSGGCSPSSASTSTPSTPAGSTTGPAGAVPCAIFASRIAASGPADGLPRSVIKSPHRTRESTLELLLFIAIGAAIAWWAFRHGKHLGSRKAFGIGRARGRRQASRRYRR